MNNFWGGMYYTWRGQNLNILHRVATLNGAWFFLLRYNVCYLYDRDTSA